MIILLIALLIIIAISVFIRVFSKEKVISTISCISLFILVGVCIPITAGMITNIPVREKIVVTKIEDYGNYKILRTSCFFMKYITYNDFKVGDTLKLGKY